jgi:hypothetical protein
VKRAQENLIKELGEDFEVKCWEEGENFYIYILLYTIIYFNKRIDLTNVMMGLKEMISLFLYGRQEHYSVTSEPGINYLFHFTPDKATKDMHM